MVKICQFEVYAKYAVQKDDKRVKIGSIFDFIDTNAMKIIRSI